MPGGIAVIVDLETDSRAKIKQGFLSPVRKNGGSMTSCAFFFTRRGRAVFGRREGIDVDSALEPAIENGAEDIEADDEGSIIVWCPPTDLKNVTRGVSQTLGLDVLDSKIVWDPKEDMKVAVDGPAEAQGMANLLSALTSELTDLQGIYTNAVKGSISDEKWEAIEEHLDS